MWLCTSKYSVIENRRWSQKPQAGNKKSYESHGCWETNLSSVKDQFTFLTLSQLSAPSDTYFKSVPDLYTVLNFLTPLIVHSQYNMDVYVWCA